MNVHRGTQIRKLDVSIRQTLSDILDMNDSWRKLASLLTQSTTDNRPLYANDEITRFGLTKHSPTLILLDDWGTRGRELPTAGILLDKLIEAELYRAADYIAVNVLNGSPPSRPVDESRWRDYDPYTLDQTIVQISLPESYPSAGQVPTICKVIYESIQSKDPASQTAISHIPYQELLKATRCFHDNYKLGQGGFGAVYLGHVQINDKRESVAVKRLNMGKEEEFKTELTAMAKFKHENLLQILGFSCDNPKAKCLVCAYMPNGSLEERLAMKNGTKPLPWNVRLNIAIGTARGLVELHNRFDPPLVHRDIKSANILLDGSFTAKIGDFGIARLGGNWQETTKAMTVHWCGTPVYMAPEAIQGSITVKMDTYSFGVVLYELITGLPPYNINRADPSLVLFITEEEEDKKALEWKDLHAGEWPDSVVETLFECATKCIEKYRRMRPLMQEVLSELLSMECQDPKSKVAITHIAYNELSSATNNFSDTTKIGHGGFGAVYKCRVQINNKYHDVAIKKLNSMGEEQQFQIELKAMAKYEHENLLQIFGFSCDNPEGKCLVCPYMPNGSLEDRLALKDGTKPLSWDVRLNISIEIARGLVELHTRYEPPLVHRDIKSANILLDANFTAKIGDFGIAHLGSNWQETTTMLTLYCRGTPVYMAKEAWQGSCTIKMDTYSFGVVLFEILTGLPPFDDTRSEANLLVYILDSDENREPIEWKDTQAGDWPDLLVERLFECATKCTIDRKKIRPTMQEVLADLELMKE